MKIEIAGKELYRQIKKQLSQRDNDDEELATASDTPSWQPEEKKTKKEVDTEPEILAGITLHPVRIPLPYGSIDGRINVLDGRYSAILELNRPLILDYDPKSLEVDKGIEDEGPIKRITPKALRRINLVERCHQLLPRALQREFRHSYVRVGESIAGYFLDVKGNPRATIDRFPDSGMIRYRTGGSGLTRLTFGEEPNFNAEMEILAEDITRILNTSFRVAKEQKLIRSVPQITLNLGNIT